MQTNHTPGARGAGDRISDSIRQALSAADSSSDIQDIIESARAALLDAEAVSLFGLETPHPDFGSVHWIVGQTDQSGSDFLVLAIPERAPGYDTPEDGGWPFFSAGAADLDEVFRLLPRGFVEAPPTMDDRQAELVPA